jgi:hypothetical protein
MTMTKLPDVIKERPEDCELGEVVLPGSVPHWDGRIRLVEFHRTNQGPDEKPWIFAASYKGLDPVGWKRVE